MPFKCSCSLPNRLLWSLPVAILLLLPSLASAQTNVTTERNDNSRTGANLNETILNTSNVNVSQFGKLFSYTVDASVYAQPLYVPNVVIPSKGTYNVLYVPTMNDSIYAFNADSNAVNGGILWSANFTNPSAGVTAIPIANIVGSNALNIVGSVGIESTPVIDLTSNTIYLVARTMEVSGSTTNYVARLHALDITTGAEKFGGPVVIQGSVPGSGQGSSAGTLTFSPFFQNQRSSLALVNGLVVFAWASHEDLDDWHGWVMAYNDQTLQLSSIYCATPNGQNAGIWMSGRGPAADSSGNLYYVTGNGDWDGLSSYGDSVIKLSTTNGVLAVTDYFTPDNYAALQTDDLDLGSSGPLLIPGTSMLITAGKTSEFFLLQSTGMGHESSGNTTALQDFTLSGAIHGGPVFWNRTTGAGPTLYVWPANGEPLQALQFTGSSFITTPLSQSTILTSTGYTDGTLSLSANGSAAGTGIVWASTGDANANHGNVAGALRAFDANNLTTELWDSTMNDSRDDIGMWAKYSPPTVVNGKVYLASFSNLVNVYGLLTSQGFGLSATPGTQTVTVGGSTSTPYTVNTTAVNGFTGSIGLSVTGLPAGASGTFSPTSVSAGSSATLSITAGSTTPVGTYTLTISGTSGALTQTATVTLVVSIDFTLSATPGVQTVKPGSSVPYTVNTTAVGSSTDTISLKVTGLPTGATGTFSPATVSAGSSSTLTIATGSSTPVGTVTLTITGTGSDGAQTATVSLTVASGSGTAGNPISIDFVGEDVAMAATEVAGVVAKANWNNASGASSTSPLALVDATGAATTATVSWSSNDIWELSIADQPGNARMMKGYLDTGNTTTTTVTVAGLPSSSSGYSVYVYADGANSGASRTGVYTISGTGITTTSISLTDAAGVDFSGTFTQANNSAGNYVIFTIPNVSGFTISATPGASTDAYPRAPINGIQIVPLSAPSPSFTLSATPGTQTVTVGGSTSTPYTVSTTALNGFAGSIGLSVAGLPAGASGTFSPTSVSAGSSATLSITAGSTTPVGTYTLTISGTSGALTQTATVTLVVSIDFTLSATPGVQTVKPGSSVPYTVSTTAVGSSTDTISLKVTGLPTGATGTFSPATVSAGSSSTLTIATGSSTPVGTVTLTITGTGSDGAQTATVSLTVASGSGTAGNPISIDFVGEDVAMAATEVAGVVAKANWNNASGASSTSPLALVDATGAATTATVSWSSNDIWELSIADQPGNARMMKGYLDTGNTTTTTVTVAGLPSSSSGYSVYVYADGANSGASRTGVYTISGTGITTTSISLTDAAGVDFSGTFTQANNSAGNYVIFTIPNVSGFTISATPGASTDAYPRAPINGIQIVPLSAPSPSFTLSATPGTQTVTVGGSTSTPYTVSTTALNGFAGSIGLSVAGLPAGASGTFSPTSVSAGSSATLSITAGSTTPVGTYTLTISGTSGALTQTATVTLVVSIDFTLSATPGVQTVKPGSSVPYTVSTTAVGSSTDTISLKVTGLPTGATGTFSPATVSAGSSSTLTIATGSSTPVGTVTLTITGTGSDGAQTATVSLTVASGSGTAGNPISIDFVGEDVAMAATEVAGVVAKANWNNASGASSTSPLALVDATGAATTATVSWSSNDIWELSIADQPGNARMMKGYLDTGNTTTTTVTVAGLPSSSSGYSVYVYADGANSGASRTGVYTISGTGITTTSISLTDAAGVDFSGTFTQANNSAGNYVIFTIPNVSGFTISATPGASTDAYPRAPINGIQIVP